MSARLYRLIYVSAARRLFSQEDLRALLGKARGNNAQNGIGGLLLYHDGSILQVLEGEEDEVRACFSRIRRDPRHGQVMCLFSAPVDQKLFPDWGMGFARPEMLGTGNGDRVRALDAVIDDLPRLAALDRRTAHVIRTFFRTHRGLADRVSAS
ncbi:BLUF domain-containing protein [Pseudoponticoccus marisrubri]|uniref:BLUF domain-containing protein n=1 Tax=Pseudoponticoccus marisrubri TaxID=1685382 RepID=A0A0W7WNC7_9RHOB|nr:BLUF domain-containing protein [Pseudoponticoccus marisrubri]KUF12058.1 hypothetical protein AVJ23_05655 [Pseudoponticoccus marisrubri]